MARYFVIIPGIHDGKMKSYNIAGDDYDVLGVAYGALGAGYERHMGVYIRPSSSILPPDLIAEADFRGWAKTADAAADVAAKYVAYRRAVDNIEALDKEPDSPEKYYRKIYSL